MEKIKCPVPTNAEKIYKTQIKKGRKMSTKTKKIEVITAHVDPIFGTTYTTTPVPAAEDCAAAGKAYQEALNRSSKIKAKVQQTQRTKNK